MIFCKIYLAPCCLKVDNAITFLETNGQAFPTLDEELKKELWAGYTKNIKTITRKVHYSAQKYGWNE